jgi:hypothetical protein
MIDAKSWAKQKIARNPRGLRYAVSMLHQQMMSEMTQLGNFPCVCPMAN